MDTARCGCHGQGPSGPGKGGGASRRRRRPSAATDTGTRGGRPLPGFIYKGKDAAGQRGRIIGPGQDTARRGRHSQVPSEQGREGGRANAAARSRARPRAREVSVGEVTLQPPTRVYIQGRDSAGRARVGSSGAIAGLAARNPTHTSAPGEILTRGESAGRWSSNGGGVCPGEGAQCAPRTSTPTGPPEPVETHFGGGSCCGRPPPPALARPFYRYQQQQTPDPNPHTLLPPLRAHRHPPSATMQKRERG